MRWIKITAVFAALLLAVDLFLLYNLAEQYKNASLVGQDSIEKTVSLLREAGIYIDGSIIPQKKPEQKIYRGDFPESLEDYYLGIASRLAGGDVTVDFTLHMINNGIKIIKKAGGASFEFSSDDIFYIKYVAGDDKAAEKYAEICIKNLPEAGNDKYDYICGIINKKFFGGNDISAGGQTDNNNNNYNNKDVKMKAEAVRYDTAVGLFIADCVETLGETEIYGCNVKCVIEDGELVYACGNIIWDTGVNFSTDLYDQISVLIDEKAYIEKQEAAPEPGAESSADGGDTSSAKESKYIIKELKCVYCINWDSARGSFYLIPAWYIKYEGDIVRIRNAVNGNIYTI